VFFKKRIGKFLVDYSFIGKDLESLIVFYEDKILCRNILDYIEIASGIDAFLSGRILPGQEFYRFKIPHYQKNEKILLQIRLDNGDKVYLDRYEATLFSRISKFVDKHINLSTFK
jgi:hypothetical protein